MNNLVEEYFINNPKTYKSLKNLSRELKMKKRKVDYLLNHSLKLRKVNPLEVRSKKFKINVYCLK